MNRKVLFSRKTFTWVEKGFFCGNYSHLLKRFPDRAKDSQTWKGSLIEEEIHKLGKVPRSRKRLKNVKRFLNLGKDSGTWKGSLIVEKIHKRATFVRYKTFLCKE